MGYYQTGITPHFRDCAARDVMLSKRSVDAYAPTPLRPYAPMPLCPYAIIHQRHRLHHTDDDLDNNQTSTDPASKERERSEQGNTHNEHEGMRNTGPEK